MTRPAEYGARGERIPTKWWLGNSPIHLGGGKYVPGELKIYLGAKVKAKSEIHFRKKMTFRNPLTMDRGGGGGGGGGVSYAGDQRGGPGPPGMGTTAE